MNRFLVLYGRIINTGHIRDILIEKNQYVITLSSRQPFSGFMIYGTGYISSDILDKLYIKKKEENGSPNLNYDKVSDFIKSVGYDMKDDDDRKS